MERNKKHIEPANNSVINAEGKTERELNELSKEYSESAE